MKTNKVLKVLSLTVLLCGLAKVLNSSDLRLSDTKLFLESTQGTAAFDDCKESFNLRGPRRLNDSVDLLASDVKVQISSVDENGNRAIRYVAAISSLDVQASFERTIYNEDGTVFGEKTVMPVEYAYDAVIAAGETIYPSSFGEEYKYFIAYTLNNVPESHWYNRIDVSVSVNEEVSERQANIEGVLQSYVQDSNLSYTERSSYPGQYQVSAVSTDITSANISDYHVVYEDVVATRGKVTAIAKKGFAECNNLELLVIPNTISYFEEMCFYNVTYIDEVRYYSNSAQKQSEVTMPNVGTLRLGADVSKLPDGMFSSTSIENLEFEGTKAEWNNVDKGVNNYLDEVKCEDSAVYEVIFHFDGGTLNGNNGTYSYETFEGKTLVNPGNPEKNGETFEGWYLDENYETKFATVPASFPEGTEEVHVYAKFVATQGGMDAEHPLTLNLGINDIVTVSSSMAHVYYSFVPTKSDYYIFKDVCTEEDKFSISGIWLYSEDMTQLAYKAATSQFELSYFLDADQTYIIKAGSHKTTAPFTEGSIQVKLTAVDGNDPTEAKSIAFGEPVTNTYLGESIPLYYLYQPDGTENAPTDVRIVNTFNSTGIIYINLFNNITGELVDVAKFNKYTTTSNAKNKDFSLQENVPYLFEIYSSVSGKEFSFELSDSPKGGTASDPFVYDLDDGKVSIPYSSLNNGYNDFNVSSSTYYFDAYYKFVPTQSFNGKLSVVNDTSTSTITKKALSVLEVYKDGVSIYSAGTASAPVKSPSVDIDFIAGSVYIIKVKSIGSSFVKPYTTSFSITVNSVITPGPDEGETDEPTTGDSLENPFVVEESLDVPSSIKLSVEAGQTKYFSVYITEVFTDLLVDSGFEVKLYSSELALLSDASSDANKVRDYGGFGEKRTYIIEIYSKNGGTTTLELQDNYDIYNEDNGGY